MALIADIDHLSEAISHATAPAFMLGAVAAFLSILIARLERVADKNKALRSSDVNLDPNDPRLEYYRGVALVLDNDDPCLLYTSPSPRD